MIKIRLQLPIMNPLPDIIMRYTRSHLINNFLQMLLWVLRSLILCIYCFPLIVLVLASSFFLSDGIFAQPSDNQDTLAKSNNLTAEKLDKNHRALRTMRAEEIKSYFTNYNCVYDWAGLCSIWFIHRSRA